MARRRVTIIELRAESQHILRTDPRDPRVAATDYRVIYRSPCGDEPNWGIELKPGSGRRPVRSRSRSCARLRSHGSTLTSPGRCARASRVTPTGDRIEGLILVTLTVLGRSVVGRFAFDAG